MVCGIRGSGSRKSEAELLARALEQFGMGTGAEGEEGAEGGGLVNETGTDVPTLFPSSADEISIQ